MKIAGIEFSGLRREEKQVAPVNTMVFIVCNCGWEKMSKEAHPANNPRIRFHAQNCPEAK